jgi:antitoxin MazE
MNTIKTKIVKIGNSQGIRIPKLLLDQTNLDQDVELEVHDNRIVIRASYPSRHGWDEQFRLMAELADDHLVDEAVSLSFWDEEDWEW